MVKKEEGVGYRIEKVSSTTLFLDRVGQLWFKKRGGSRIE
jgi:hypothetical protein